MRFHGLKKFYFHTADLKDSEAVKQSQLAQVAASEIEKLTEEKEHLSKSLADQV